jgi:hypothetical protein
MGKKKEEKLNPKRKKNLKDDNTYKSITNQEEIEKSGILSALDQIDRKDIEQTRIIEEKLRAGLIKSEKTKSESEIKDIEVEINEIKDIIEKLRKIKKKQLDNKEFEEAIEISKKIITLAFTNNLKEIVNNEKEFLEQTKIISNHKSETKKILNKREDSNFTLLQGQTTNLKMGKLKPKLHQAKIQDKEETEGESRRFMIEKEEIRQEKLNLEEEKEAFKWEKQMLEEVKKYQRDKKIGKVNEKINDEVVKSNIEEIKKFKEAQLNFEREKKIFQKEKLEFEEQKEKFHQERLEFEEEQEVFKWEKQMFEEMKKQEKKKTLS